MSILITGHIDVDGSKRDDFIALAQALMKATHEEEGCEHYSFAADLDEPTRFHISERWADAATQAAHSASPHLAKFMGSLGGIVTGASLTQWDGATPTKLM